MYTLPERQSSESDKIWKQGNFKNTNFPTVWWIGKNLEVQSKLTFRNPNFQYFPWISKNWEVHLEQHSKIRIFNLKPSFQSIYFESVDVDKSVDVDCRLLKINDTNDLQIIPNTFWCETCIINCFGN